MKRYLWVLALTLLVACGNDRDMGGKVYLPQFSLPNGESRVLIYNYPDLEYLGQIPAGSLAMRAAKRPGSHELWVCCEASRDITLIDTRDDSLIKRFQIGNAASGGAFTPDGSLFVVGHGAQIIKRKGSAQASIVDAYSHKVLATFDVGADPYNVAVSADGHEAYVANNGDHTITRIDLIEQRVLDTVETGPGPYSLTVDPAGDKLYVSCRGKDAESAGSFFIHTLPSLERIEHIASESHPVQFLKDADDCLLTEAKLGRSASIRKISSDNLQSGASTWTLELNADPGLARVTDSGNWMLVTLGGSEIACVDLETGEVRSRRLLPNANQNHIALDLEVLEFSP